MADVKPIKRIVVIGCGGLGGVVAARLAEAGHNVTAVTGNPEITAALHRNGLTASYDDQIHNVRIAATDHLRDEPFEPFDLCVLAVPPNAAIEALRDALPHLDAQAQVVSLPNGLIEERLRGVLPPERIIGGIVEFGARMLAPGRVSQTAPGGLTVGRLPEVDGLDPALAAATDVLRDVGPIHLAQNLRGARWSKLAINCAISSLGTIGGDRLGALMRHRFVRRLCLETMTEVVDIARAEGVQLEKVSGTLDLDWLALSDEERLKKGAPSLLAKHTLLLAVGTKYRNMRSSMLAALERGRTPPVDYLNGEITDRGQRRDIPTPINQALQDAVHAIAAGRSRSSVETLHRVYQDSRDTLRELEMVG